MNSASKHAVAALLVFFLAGCAPKNPKTAPPTQAQAPATPVPDAGKAGAMFPPPLTESQTQAQPATPAPAPEVAKTEPEPEPEPPPPPAAKKSTHKPKPSAAKPGTTDSSATSTTASDASATPPASGTPAGTDPATTQVATKTEPAASSPIGELTPADTPEQAQKGKDTGDLIAKTEDGLNSIKRQLSTQELETVSQIKAFLGKAKIALSNEDFDGAYILATKAKVLLDELNKT
jgi:hypothetical protein